MTENQPPTSDSGALHEGQILKTAAKRSSLGVNGIAEAFNMPRTSLYYWFSKPQLEPWMRTEAARALGTTVEELFVKGNTRPSIHKDIDPDKVREELKDMFKVQTDESGKVIPKTREDYWAMRDRLVALGATDNNPYSVIPFVPIYAYTGYLTAHNNRGYLEDLPNYVTEKLRDEAKYRGFEVRGDSMDDGTSRSILEGYMVLGKRVEKELWEHKLMLRKEMIIVHQTEGIIVRQVTGHDTQNGSIVCHSYNHKYNDMRLNLSDVIELYYVKEIKIKKP